MESFRRYKTKAKHGIEFDVYQYIDEDKTGLNIKTPEVFFLPRPVVKGPLKLTKSAAYYLAHAIKNEKFFISKKGVYPNFSTILLHFLARDSTEKSSAGKYREPVFMTWKANSAPIQVQWDYYSKVDNWVAIGFSDRLQADLVGYADCFEFVALTMYTFVNKKGQKKLRDEWPEIWQEFSLDELG